MTEYDIDNDYDVHILFYKITLPSLGYSMGYKINMLSNYFQILLVLKGIKIGFMCADSELIDLRELETLIKRNKIANVRSGMFLFIKIGLFRMIVNKNQARNVLLSKVSRDINWTDNEIINYVSQMTNHHISDTIDSEIISSLLSYDCSMKGIEKGFVRVKYNLQLNSNTKLLFGINNDNILIYGFICSQDQIEYTREEIQNRARQINMYFDTELQLGRVSFQMT